VAIMTERLAFSLLVEFSLQKATAVAVCGQI
jgi:hypothetical protein